MTHSLHTAFLTHYRPMVVAAHHYVKDWQAAEDIAQEAFIRLHRKGAVKSVKDMLFILVRNLSVSYLRKQGSRPDKAVLIYEDGYVADGEVVSEAMFIALYKAIERLPGRQRDLLRKMYSEGLSRSDAARALGMDVSTAGVHFNRAKGMLKQLLKHEYYGYEKLLTALHRACAVQMPLKPRAGPMGGMESLDPRKILSCNNRPGFIRHPTRTTATGRYDGGGKSAETGINVLRYGWGS